MTGDKIMPELHLKQPRFTYGACGSFTKNCERIQKFRESGNLNHLYRNETDKACFSHNAAYSDINDLAKRTISDKILKDITYEIARNCKYDGYQRALTSMVYTFFDKKTGSGVSVSEQLVEELRIPVIKKFRRRRFCVRFKDNIWAAGLAETELLSSENKNVKYLLCVIDVFTKYA